MSNKNSKALHEIVAANIIKKLELGTAPWQMPWNSNGASFTLPYNPITGNRYKGINTFSLLSAERNDPRWLTFKQAHSQGWTVNKGEKASLIQYVKTHDYINHRDEQGRIINSENGKPKKDFIKLDRPVISTAWVFNAEQITGIEPLKIIETSSLNWQSQERVENLIKKSNAEIFHSNEDKAYYNPTKDRIVMPFRNQFDAADKYYSTILHELGHWTAHKDRLDRNINYPYGTPQYAKEELRAEIASMLIGHELKIGHDPLQHIAYVDSWIKLLKDNPFEIHAAAMEAEKILNYIIQFDISRVTKISNQSEEHHSKKVKIDSSLNMGDTINYNNSTYKIHSLLKRGRYKIENLSSGNNFILSKTDALYTSLISAKDNAKVIPIDRSSPTKNNEKTEEKSNIISIKR